jgi:Domain of unknown function (DUF4314)
MNVGDRVELDQMRCDPLPIRLGTRGTVLAVDPVGVVLVHWDTGQSLGLVPGEDAWTVLMPDEVFREALDAA